MAGQVPGIRAPQYGAQAAASNAAFDANNAQRRMAEAKLLEGILSNAESAQNVFGGGSLANLASVAGGVNPNNFNADFIGMSDRLNQAQRNADVVNTLAQASERMPDARVSLGDFASPPGFGVSMEGHVDAGDRAAFAMANALKPKDAGLADTNAMFVVGPDGQYRRMAPDAAIQAGNMDPSLTISAFPPGEGQEMTPGKKLIARTGDGVHIDAKTPSGDDTADIVVADTNVSNSNANPAPTQAPVTQQQSTPVQPAPVDMTGRDTNAQLNALPGVQSYSIDTVTGEYVVKTIDGQEVRLPPD